MSYQSTFGVSLGVSRTGDTLTAQLIDTAGANVGSAVTTGFYEVGRGLYQWVGTIPDDHRGGVVFTSSGTVMAYASINEEELENTDLKVSTRSTLTAAQVDTQLSSVHGAGSWVDAAVPAGTYQFVSVVVGDTITAKRGDRWVIPLTVGSLTGQTQVWFTVKKSKKDPDSRAIVQITRTGGLIRSNGSPATSGNGSLTINTESTGAITIVVNQAETDDYPDFTDGWWDVQMLDANGITTKAEGVFKITEDVTRAIS